MRDIRQRLHFEYASAKIQKVGLRLSFGQKEFKPFGKSLQVVAARRVIQIEWQLLDRFKQSDQLVKQINHHTVMTPTAHTATTAIAIAAIVTVLLMKFKDLNKNLSSMR